ncbi:hypothetical protein BHE74_00047235, partial [Ensete ventricosum]
MGRRNRPRATDRTREPRNSNARRNRFLPLLLPLLLSPSIDRRRPKSTVDNRFRWYRPIVGSPRTGQLANQYVPPGTGPYRLYRAVRTVHTAGKVCNFDIYRPVRVVHTDPPSYRYTDRPLPSGSTKNRPSTIDFDSRQSIEGEIDRRRLIERGKGRKKKRKKKKKKEKRRKKTYRPRAIAAGGSRAVFLPRREKDRGDVEREKGRKKKRKNNKKKEKRRKKTYRPRAVLTRVSSLLAGALSPARGERSRQR